MHHRFRSRLDVDDFCTVNRRTLLRGLGATALVPAAADAALLARVLPGRPVRVQWLRQDEHSWEPYGPAMVMRARAALDGNGTIMEWNYEIWSPTHSARPTVALC
jgi:hypothetical protein